MYYDEIYKIVNKSLIDYNNDISQLINSTYNFELGSFRILNIDDKGNCEVVLFPNPSIVNIKCVFSIKDVNFLLVE